MCKCNKKKSCDCELCVYKLKLIESLLIPMNREVAESITVAKSIDDKNWEQSKNELNVLLNVLYAQVNEGIYVTQYTRNTP